VLDIEALRKAVSSVKPDLLFISRLSRSCVSPTPIQSALYDNVWFDQCAEVVRLALDRCVLQVTTDKCHENREGFARIVKRIQWAATIPTARAKPLQRSLLLRIAAHFRNSLDRRRLRLPARERNAIGGGDGPQIGLFPVRSRVATVETNCRAE
jgi:hypothetical protein